MVEFKKLLALATVSTFALIVAGNSLTWAQDNSSPTQATQAAMTGEKNTTDQEDETLDSVTIYPDADKAAVYTSPLSSIYLSAQQLDRYGRLSAGDMLKTLPGVGVGDSRNGGGVDVNIRGIQGQSRVAVTVDGSQQALDVYRGYAGMQQRSYIDQDLIRNMVVTKGPGLDVSASSGIGGSVRMETLRAEDIILPGKNWEGDLMSNGLKPADRSATPKDNADLYAVPRSERNTFIHSDAKSGSGVFAIDFGHIDFVAGFARRNQGNYITGRHGADKYRSFDKWGYEQNSVAKSYQPGEEVLNSSARNDSLLLKSTLELSDAQNLELTYRRYDGHFGEIMPSDIWRSGTAGVYQYPEGSMDIHAATARYSFNPEENNWLNVNTNLWWTGAKSSQLNDVNGPISERFVTDRSWVRVNNDRFGGDISNKSELATSFGDFSLKIAGGFQYEEVRPQKGVVISEQDRNMNRLIRDGSRVETNLSAQLDYKPIDALTLWGAAKFNSFNSHDRNQYSTAVREKLYGRYITVSKPGLWGSMFWRPDANGNFTDATDPRLNNGIVWTNSNNPFEGTHFNELEGVNTTAHNPEWSDMVVGFTQGDKLKSKDHAFAPSLGVNYEIVPDTFLYARYSEAIRLPSLFETTRGTLQVVPSNELKPERMQAFELGASTTLGGLITAGDETSLKLSYFHNNIQNFITRRYNPLSTGMMEMKNAKSYTTSGLEFQSSYDSGRIFVDLSATYYLNTKTCDPEFAAYLRSIATSWMHTEDTPNCTPGGFMGSYVNAQNPPRLAANLTLGSRFFDEKLVVGTRVTHTSEPTEKITKEWQVSATTPQIYYHPVTLLDAFVSYQINEHGSLNASLTNITDRYYLDPLAQSFMPAPGRTFRLGFTTQF